MMMSTGLTFGTTSSLYGLSHGIVTQEQYSFLVAAVIASAVVPTIVEEVAPLYLAIFFKQTAKPQARLSASTKKVTTALNWSGHERGT